MAWAISRMTLLTGGSDADQQQVNEANGQLWDCLIQHYWYWQNQKA